eukprot:gb/GEZN01000320.1/.p1 GENE.gb/GEZN01000320.1/~~gb/GEZN01000320.1/.p1  ORF type:complete len:1541 (-),score=288.70 gb/GEZN01000320.1/:342-4964(-)
MSSKAERKEVPAALPADELDRLEALRSYNILDSEPEESFERITRTVASVCETPIAAISLVDENRQWFKSIQGLDAKETSRDVAFCAHTILLGKDDLLTVNDSLLDRRFRWNPLVTGGPKIRFYAGTPLTDPEGFKLGSLCAISDAPHELNAGQTAVLKALGRQVVIQMRSRKKKLQLKRNLEAMKLQQDELEKTRALVMEASHSKSRFLSNMSHEIRTPMNGIMGFADLLEEFPNLTQQQCEYVDHIRTAGASLLLVINDVLDLSKIEAGRFVLSQGPCSLDHAVEEAIAVAAEQARRNNKLEKVSLLYTLDEHLPQQVVADQPRLTQVLANILISAISNTTQGHVLLQVKVAERTENAEAGVTLPSVMVEFNVRDSGCGLSAAGAEALFEGFDSRIQQDEGRALALAISFELVKTMGGKLSLQARADPAKLNFNIMLPMIPVLPTPKQDVKHTQLEGPKFFVAVVADPMVSEAFEQAWLCKCSQHSARFPPACFWTVETWDGLVERLEQSGEPLDAVLLDKGVDGFSVEYFAKQLNIWFAERQKPTPLILKFCIPSQKSKSPKSAVSADESIFASEMQLPLHFSQEIPKLLELLMKRSSLGPIPLDKKHNKATRKSMTPSKKKSIASDLPMAQRFPTRILVAEDNRLNMKLLVKLLSNCGYTVSCCENGQEVIDRVVSKGEEFDLILMDVHMPVMDGLEATRILKQHRLQVAPTSRLPVVVACTASVMESEQQECFASGMEDLICKPFTRTTVTRCIQKWWRASRDLASPTTIITATAPQPIPAKLLEKPPASIVPSSRSATRSSSFPLAAEPQSKAMEQLRLEALYSYNLLDTPREDPLDQITQALALFCGTPMSAISLIDEDRQWFKSKVGMETDETPRDISFCDHTIRESPNSVMEIRDTLEDAKFKLSPLVKTRGIRFYGGSPLVDADSGLAIGALCAMDRRPRTLTPVQKEVILTLSAEVMIYLDLRKQLRSLKDSIDQLAELTKVCEKKLEEARLYNQAKGRFLANMSYEIRSPLNVVIGFAQLLGDTELDAQESNYVEHIKSSGAHLLGVINDILDLGSLGAGVVKLYHQPIVLQDIIEEAMQLAFRVDKAEVQVFYVLDPTLPREVLGDATRLRQVLTNLLGNAIKFTHEGSVRLTVQRTGADLQTIRFSVTDTGLGIPLEKQGTLFEPFSQVDQSSRRQYGGTGLGLTISKHLTTLMGGILELSSSMPGMGSTFSALLPLRTEVCFVVAVVCPKETLEQAFAAAWLQRSISQPRRNSEAKFLAVQSWPELEDLLLNGAEPLDVLLLTRGLDGKNAKDSAKEVLHWARESKRQAPLLLRVSVPERRADSAPNESPDTSEIVFDGHMCLPLWFSQEIPKLESLLKERRGGAIEVKEEEEDRKAKAVVKKKKVGSDKSLAQRFPMRILVAEDNGLNMKMLVRLLSNFGYTCTTCINGQEVIDLVVTKGNEFDLILMDVFMPVMDGLEATRLLKEHQKSSKAHVPVVIACTASAMESEQQECLQRGMDDVICKPVVPTILRGMIIKWSAHKDTS